MAKKYIDADLLKKEIEKRKSLFSKEKGKKDASKTDKLSLGGRIAMLEEILVLIDSLQQEQPIKVYRVENEKEQKGLWRKFDGTWEPLFDMLTDGQCKDVPMDDSPIYREGGKQWFASAPSKKTLQKWFSKRDLEELTAAGFTITEFEVVEYRKLSDFEYIFTRESIVNKTNIDVVDIYPQEQPCDTCTNDKGCVTCKDGELWEGKEQPSEDLENVAEEKYPVYWKDYPKDGIVRSESSYDTNKKCRDAFIAGAEWQKEQDIKEMAQSKSPLSVAYANRCFENGKQAMKEQMLKDAVEGGVEELYNDGEIHCTVGVGTYFKPGDEVYVIKKEN